MATTAFNPADKTGANVVLTNSNLTVTMNGFSVSQGVRAVDGASSGKGYFEILLPTAVSAGTDLYGLAVGTVPPAISTGAVGAVVLTQLGFLHINNTSNAGGVALGSRAVNDIMGFAFNLDLQLIWARLCPSGLWNSSGSADPAAGIGGISYAALGGGLFYPIVASSFSSGVAMQGNFGASAFNGAVPSGFTAGWPPVAAPVGGLGNNAMILA